MPNDRVLILGGTREARELALILVAGGLDVITSLAGITAGPVLPEGAVRRGGFGGVDGLVRYLLDDRIAAIVDATHPFALQMSGNAAAAARIARIPLLRVERPAWISQPGDMWIIVQSATEAAAIVPAGARAFLAIGGKEMGVFFGRDGISGVARMIEPFRGPVHPEWTIILQRPPFELENEMKLLLHHRVTHLVTKNSGGSDTSAKLDAARRLGLPVVMIARPAKLKGMVFATPTELAAALRLQLLP